MGVNIEEHKAKALPAVDFARDGRVYVTDGDGTFPLRSKSTSPLKDINLTFSGRDVDKQEYAKPRRYKQRQPLPTQNVAEWQAMAKNGNNGTVVNGTSSLSRKVRRNKKQKFDFDRAFDSVRSTSSWSSVDSDPDFPLYSSIGRSSGRYDYSNQYDKPGINPQFGRTLSVESGKVRRRKRSNEELPFVLFLLIGIMLLVLGLARLLICWWHEYGCALWTGTLCVALGVVGIFHNADYKHTIKNIAYIVLAVLVCVCGISSCDLVLAVFVPISKGLAANVPSDDLVFQVAFSSLNGSLVNMAAETDIVLYISLALDVCTLAMLLCSFYSLHAAIVAANNFWDANYDVTGECDHRGNPKLFNPLHQLILGQATLFVGLFTTSLLTSSVNHGESMVWSGGLVMIAAVVSACYGKRPDLMALGVTALVGQIVAVLGMCVSAVIVTTVMVDDINSTYSIVPLKSSQRSNIHASIVFQAFYLIAVIINIIFIVGVFFRNCRLICDRAREEREQLQDIDHTPEYSIA